MIPRKERRGIAPRQTHTMKAKQNASRTNTDGATGARGRGREGSERGERQN